MKQNPARLDLHWVFFDTATLNTLDQTTRSTEKSGVIFSYPVKILIQNHIVHGPGWSIEIAEKENVFDNCK